MAETETAQATKPDLKKSTTRRLSTLDGTRAIAALGVLVFHCAASLHLFTSVGGPLRYVFAMIQNLGNFGVAVFFVLSGYFLFREFVRKLLFDGRQTPIAHYFERRFLRIYPAYWVALVAYLIIFGAASLRGGLFGLLTLTERQFSNSVFSGMPITWTLYIEVTFYFFVPIFSLVLWLVCRRRDSSIRASIVLGSLVGLVVAAHVWIGVVISVVPVEFKIRLLMNLPAYLGWFAAGMALSVASVWVSENRSLPHPIGQLVDHPMACWAISLAAYIAVVVTEWSFQIDGTLAHEPTLMLQTRMFLQGAAAMFFVLPMAIGRRTSRSHSIVGARPLAWVGVISYGVYLWHPILIVQVMERLGVSPNIGGFLLLVAVVMPGAIVIGWLSFRIIEKPALSYAR